MRLKALPDDFCVEEQIRSALSASGAHLVCRIRKRGITTLAVQEQLAARLRIGKSQIAFPALKDKEAVAVQYVSIALPPSRTAELAGAHFGGDFTVEPLGRAPQALRTADLRGNRFDIVVRDLSLSEAQAAGPRLRQMADFGVPNYFDEQRFGSYAGDAGYIGKRILQRDAEGALRIYLSISMAGDPERVRVYKEYARDHWGDWGALLDRAPKPSNFRSVLTYLKDHPEGGWRKALNLIPPSLLALYLAAYQSYLWNRIVALYLAKLLAEASFAAATIRVAGQDLPVIHNLPEQLRRTLERARVALPNHQALYPEAEWSAAAQSVLDAEGLTLNDFKARILKRAFATRALRPLLVHPESAEAGGPENDDLARRRWKVRVRFALPPGSYATIVVKALFA